MKRKLHRGIYLFVLALLIASNQTANAQTVAITLNPQSSGNIVVGPNLFHVSENIYTEAEIGAAVFTSAATAINHIDFNAVALGSITTVDSFNIYLKEVPLSNVIFSNGIYDTAGYSLVFSGTLNASVIGWVGVNLTSSFIRISGNNLQLLIERKDNVTHGGFSFNAARGNSTGATLTSSRRINSATRPLPGTTSLSTSNFRPQVQLRQDRKSTRLNSSHVVTSRMPSSA